MKKKNAAHLQKKRTNCFGIVYMLVDPIEIYANTSHRCENGTRLNSKFTTDRLCVRWCWCIGCVAHVLLYRRSHNTRANESEQERERASESVWDPFSFRRTFVVVAARVYKYKYYFNDISLIALRPLLVDYTYQHYVYAYKCMNYTSIGLMHTINFTTAQSQRDSFFTTNKKKVKRKRTKIHSVCQLN